MAGFYQIYCISFLECIVNIQNWSGMEEGTNWKNVMTEIMSAYQYKTFAEDIEMFATRGDSLQWITDALETDFSRGIEGTEIDIARREQRFGSNKHKQFDPPGLCHLIWEALKDFTLRILLVSACFSIILQTSTADEQERSVAWIDGFAILIAVVVCAMVTAVNDYQKERQFQQLNSVAQEKKVVTLKRGGAQLILHQQNLLVGDIVDVVEGMEVPADGFLIQASEVTADQSAMTGQSDPLPKQTLDSCLKKREEMMKEESRQKNQMPSPVLMSGTKVLTGEGKMVVTVVGQQSCLGRIRAILEQDEAAPTPLQQKLEELAGDIGKFGLYSAVFIVIVLLIRFAIVKITATSDQDKWQTGKDLLQILNFVILGITVLVVAIPEGLPLSVTLSLAFSVKKMLKDNNLVRKMEACETMGGANNICSDKTGTLTMNKMNVAEIWNGCLIKINFYQEQLSISQLSSNQQWISYFKMACLVNSSAQLQPEERGSSTEIAFLKYFKRLGISYQQERSKAKIEVKYPFSSSRKRMSIIVSYKDQLYLFTKGASEMIVSGCQDWLNPLSGSIESLNHDRVEEVIHKMAGNALRTLGVAFKKISSHDCFDKKDAKGVYDVEKNNLILLAVVGVRDIPRKEVPQAIQLCHQAGITVRMVTGDNLDTAKAIAKDIGLDRINKNFKAMEGSKFNQVVGGIVCKKCKTARCNCPTTQKQSNQTGEDMRVDTIGNPEAFDQLVDDLLILARSRPEDKYCLVTGLKERGNVVAVTGDGTNDAPALKKADVGFAMGICGTEVARQASAIILIDDNFSSIVKAVLWGRNIYDSIRKFIQFQLTVNIVAVVITLIGAALLQKQVLRPIQMLWINLIMDTLASLALATEDPHPDLLKRKPHPRDDYIINKTMLKHIIIQSLFQITIMLILIFMGETFIPEYPNAIDSTEPYLSHPEYRWRNGVLGGTICSGRFYYLNGDKDYEHAFETTKNYSRHFTIIFNTFVMMQVFNFLNARKLHQEFNIFAGIFSNAIFGLVVIIIVAVQIILVSFAGYAFGMSSQGLTIQQWLICIGLGAIGLVVSFIAKLIPLGREVPPEGTSSKVMPEKIEVSGQLQGNNSKLLFETGQLLELGQRKDLDKTNDMLILNEPQETLNENLQ